MTRIVSLTPSRIDRDTRTFKEAASFARHGMESVVVEAIASEAQPRGMPFRLHRIGPAGDATAAAADDDGGSTAPPGPWGRVSRPARGVANRALRVPLTAGRYLAAGRAAAASLPAADVYWLHGYHQLPQAWLAARRHRAALVYDAHDFYPEVIEGGEATAIERRAMRAFYLGVERSCARAASEIVTVSDGVAGLIFERTGRRPTVIRNCAELRDLPDDGPDVRTAAGVGPEDFLVVMPGNHKAGMRAVDEAVEAFAALPDAAHLAFVGSGYAGVVERAARLGLGSRVHALAPVPAEQVPTFIRSADAAAVLYVPTSRNIEHALPNGFFSAIAAGLPVLWPARLREIARLAAEHDLGLPIEPLEPTSIAAGVRALLDDAGRLRSLRANVERARAVLNWEAEERRLMGVVARVMNGRG
jgi:glycosyltransferase involved in cell wall biosynthesis